MNEVKPGMKFKEADCLMVVVKPNPAIPGDWFCRGLEADTGLWSFNGKDILNKQVPDAR